MRFAPTITLFLLSTPCFAQIAMGVSSGYGGPAAQTNNPVSMVFEHKQTQTLADGTHINTVTHEYFYRDSLGRTRMENEVQTFGFVSGTPMHSVNVHDPVARTSTNWQTGGPEGRAHQFNRYDQNPPQRPLMTTAPISSQSHLLAPPPVQPASRPRPKTTTESLGTQDVQGVPCEASRTTVVYPVDFFGNDRPITTVMERCQSREFDRVLRDSTEDPRSGTRTTTLQSISRGEPDPSLFQPPPDYVDSKSMTR